MSGVQRARQSFYFRMRRVEDEGARPGGFRGFPLGFHSVTGMIHWLNWNTEWGMADTQSKVEPKKRQKNHARWVDWGCDSHPWLVFRPGAPTSHGHIMTNILTVVVWWLRTSWLRSYPLAYPRQRDSRWHGLGRHSTIMSQGSGMSPTLPLYARHLSPVKGSKR